MGAHKFLKNQWYVSARANELNRKPLARMICGEPIVVWRCEDGRAVALSDRCPHRLLNPHVLLILYHHRPEFLDILFIYFTKFITLNPKFMFIIIPIIIQFMFF